MLKLISTYKNYLVLFFLNFYISTNVFHYDGNAPALANAQTCNCIKQVMPINSKIAYLMTEVDDIKTNIQNQLIAPPSSGQASNLELKHSEDVKKLEKKIEDLTTLVKSLENAATNLKTNMDTIINDKVQRQVQAIGSQLKEKIDDNLNDIQRIDRKTKESDAKLRDLTDKDAQITSRLFAVETQIGKLKTSNHNQNLPVENQKKIENLERIVQGVKSEMQEEVEAIQDQLNEFDSIPNKVKETERKLLVVENKCHAISLSSNNLVNEINTLKLKISPDGGFVSNVKLQDVVKRLENIEKKPLILIEDFNKQILHVINAFMKNVKYTNWYGLQFTHRMYLEELYEDGQIKYKYYLVH